MRESFPIPRPRTNFTLLVILWIMLAVTDKRGAMSVEGNRTRRSTTTSAFRGSRTVVDTEVKSRDFDIASCSNECSGEIVRLRMQVEQLQSQLMQAQSENKKALKNAYMPNPSVTSSTSDSDISSKQDNAVLQSLEIVTREIKTDILDEEEMETDLQTDLLEMRNYHSDALSSLRIEEALSMFSFPRTIKIDNVVIETMTAGISSMSLPETEMKALRDLYTSTGGPYWQWPTPSHGIMWNISNHTANPCYDNWQGISCTCTRTTAEEHGFSAHYYYGYDDSIRLEGDSLACNIEKIYLKRMGLKGRIPKSIENFNNLTHLQLSFNALSGSIPETLYNLTNLLSLGLDSTAVSGSISNYISKLDRLQSFSLRVNKLTGTIPEISMLTSLQVINLDRNPLSGRIPTLSTLNNLRSFAVSSTQLTGQIPEISSLTNLVWFTSVRNRLTGPLPIVSTLTKLEMFSLRVNMLTGSIPILSNLVKLEALRLSDNKLTGTIPTLSTLTKLDRCHLQNNLLSGHIPIISSLTNLQFLELNNNLLSGHIPIMSNLLNIKSLSLSDNKLSGVVPTISTLIKLEHLYLDRNKLSGSLDWITPNLLLLNSLKITNNRFSGQLSGVLLPSINVFDVRYNNFTGPIPPNYCSIQLVLITNNQFSCAPGCLYKVLSVSDQSIARCHGPEDDALCSLEDSSDIGESYFQSSVTFGDAIYPPIETSHPYSVVNISSFKPTFENQITKGVTFNSKNHRIVKQVPFQIGATMFKVLFNAMSALYAWDSYIVGDELWLCHDRDCLFPIDIKNLVFRTKNRRIRINGVYMGVNSSSITRLPTETIMVRANGTFYFVLYTNNINNINSAWGFQATVTPGVLNKGWKCVDVPAKLQSYASMGSNSRLLANNNAALPIKRYAGDYCDWTGITACNLGKDITGLDLSSRGVKGTLPSSLGKLTTLQTVKLNSNQFYGSIPSELGALSYLQTLDLSSNDLTGAIPKTFSKLRNLAILRLGNNAINGSIPSSLALLSSLEQLSLSTTSLHGQIPRELCPLAIRSSVYIDLSSNPQLDCLEPYFGDASKDPQFTNADPYVGPNDCWESDSAKNHLQLGDLAMCAPTSQPSGHPTSQPSGQPTYMPTSPSSSPTGKPTAGTKYVAAPSITAVSTSVISGAVVGSVAFLVLIVLSILYYLYQKSDTKKRYEQLKQLPLHRLIMNWNREGSTSSSQRSRNVSVVSPTMLEVVANYDDEELRKVDFDGKTPFDLALLHCPEDMELIFQLVIRDLPIHCDIQEVDECPKKHAFSWIKLVALNQYADVVDRVLSVFIEYAKELANACDKENRRAIDIAARPDCQRIVKRSTYLLKRYEQTTAQAHHESSTSLIYICIDHESVDQKHVAVKFMAQKEQWLREISARRNGGFNAMFVVDVLQVHDSDEDITLQSELTRKGFGNFPYILVMPAGERNLQEIVSKEMIAARDWTFIKNSASYLITALSHMHDQGYVHCDVKLLNVIRLGEKIMLIDLDAAAQIGSGFSCAKFSSMYLPPECIHYDQNTDMTMPKTFSIDPTSGKPLKDYDYDLVPASTTHDSWSLGVLLYHLCSGEPLFLANFEDNIDMKQMKVLYEFPDSFKREKMAKITDKFARNLISQLLNKNPTLRPTMDRAIAHPFITGKNVMRMPGDVAPFHMMLSYRVASDSDHAEYFYNRFTSMGYRVWWDKKCLKPGEPWEVGFANGLVNSSILVPLLSRGALNHPTNDRSNVTQLSKTSLCDNVLLEYRFGMELKDREMLDLIYPILIGDKDANGVYTNYFGTGCHPNLSTVDTVVVDKIEDKLYEHLGNHALGSPMVDNMSVAEILNGITANQGGFVMGTLDEACQKIDVDVKNMVDAVRSKQALRIAQTVSSSALLQPDASSNDTRNPRRVGKLPKIRADAWN